MLISAIVICRNSLEFINSCIESICIQTLPLDEIIIIDGNSTDGTTEFIRSRQNLTLFSQNGEGIANARNQGIKASRGDLIAFLDADDVWSHNKLELQYLHLQRNQALQAVGCTLVKTNEHCDKTWTAMTPGGFLFRKEVFEQFGDFNEQMLVAQDHEWFKRSIKSGLKYEILPETLLTKTIHGNNISLIKNDIYLRELMSMFRLK